jgi:hypothetical protein
MSESMQKRCGCAQCQVRRLMGPVMLITIGAIFLVHQYTRYGMGTLWPLMLIVPGVILVAASLVSDEGHVGP